MYSIQISTAFKKDYKRVANNKKAQKLIEETLHLLITGENLPEKYKEHHLKGNLKGYIDAHIEPDLIIIFKRDKKNREIKLARLGNHANLNLD